MCLFLSFIPPLALPVLNFGEMWVMLHFSHPMIRIRDSHGCNVKVITRINQPWAIPVKNQVSSQAPPLPGTAPNYPQHLSLLSFGQTGCLINNLWMPWRTVQCVSSCFVLPISTDNQSSRNVEYHMNVTGSQSREICSLSGITPVGHPRPKIISLFLLGPMQGLWPQKPTEEAKEHPKILLPG